MSETMTTICEECQQEVDLDDTSSCPYCGCDPLCPNCVVPEEHDCEPEVRISYDRTTPCHVCPFDPESAEGWLGQYTPEEVMDVARGEGRFLCHDSVDYDQPHAIEEALCSPETQHCAGMTIFRRKMCKLPRDPDLAEHGRKVDTDVPILFPADQFIEHHTIDRPKRRKRKKKGT